MPLQVYIVSLAYCGEGRVTVENKMSKKTHPVVTSIVAQSTAQTEANLDYHNRPATARDTANNAHL